MIPGSRGLGLVLLALAVGGAACGGGSSGGSVSDTTAPADDQGAAQRANLVVGDFPVEWKSTALAADTAAVNLANDRAFALCMGRPPPEQDRTALADSPNFAANDTRAAASSVQLVRTVEIAQADFAALRDDRALGCHKARIDAEFVRQLPGSSPQTTVERLALPQFGDESVAFRVEATTLAQGVQVRTLIDLVFVRKGRTEMSANFINRATPFPSDLEKSLLQRMVGRA